MLFKQVMRLDKIIITIVKKPLYYLCFLFRTHHLILRFFSKTEITFPLVVLLYHQIIDGKTRYLDKGSVIHHHVKQFEKEMKFLSGNFRLASLDEVVNQLSRGEGFRQPTVVITFDDGYLNNYNLAYPVLRKYRVPATIYLATELIGTNLRTWPDQIEWALLETNREQIEMPELFDNGAIRLKSIHEKELANVKIAQALKRIPDAERRTRLRELFSLLGVDGASSEDRIMLNWEEVLEMSKNGITFGSHGHGHPILSRLPVEVAREDIRLSKQIMEEKLGQQVKHFAYPNGSAEDFTEDLRTYCRQIGFNSVATVLYGTNAPGESDVFALKRIGANSPVWMLAGEVLKENILFQLRKRKG